MPVATRSTGRCILFIAGGAVVLLAATELLARAISFQLRDEYPTALLEALDGGWAPKPEKIAAEVVRDNAETLKVARTALRREAGAALLAEIKVEYDKHFAQLVADVRAAGSKFFVLNFLSPRHSAHGRFIAELVEKHGVDYLDLSSEFLAVPEDYTMLLPYDHHLTRYGNMIVAEKVAEFLARYEGHRSGREYTGAPRVLGDFPDSVDNFDRVRQKALRWNAHLGFAIDVNAQGFRNSRDVATTKKRQRVLCLGDSYTFGIHVNNVDTYPAIVERLRPGVEMLNAGISGYTISDQQSLFAERAVKAAPDVTLLQVCDNDFLDLTAWNRNLFGRSGRGAYEPSEEEQRFFAGVAKRIAKNAEHMTQVRKENRGVTEAAMPHEGDKD